VIGIIEYDMGNIQSVANALEYLSVPAKIITKPEELSGVDKIILPGVGAFGEGMEKLAERGFIEALNKEVLNKRKYFLGICLGMQLICKESFEFGHFKGLGWLDVSVRKLKPASNFRVPHVGWNNLIIKKENRLINFNSGDGASDVYFVHSYYADASNADFVIATCEYGMEFPVAIEKDNIFATQFHPEKSQGVGLDILGNFSRL
jgi:glutamine amidotransferase